MRSRIEISAALPLAAAIISLAYNGLTVYLCMHLPSNPFHLSTYIAVYSMAGCGFGLFGLAGILQRRASAVRLFAQFLLIDAFLSVIGRMLLEEFFVETLNETNICGNQFNDEHWSKVNPGYAAMHGARWESKFKHLFSSVDDCNMGLVVLHFVAVAAMILTSAAQISLSVLLHKYGRQLESSRRYKLWTIHEVDEKFTDDEI